MNKNSSLFSIIFVLVFTPLFAQDDCDPYLVCGQALTCVDRLLYPTTCGPENCDEPIGECDDDEYEEEENQWNCSDIGTQQECEYAGCDWSFSNNMPAGGYCSGYIDDEDFEDDCRYLESEDECIYEGCMWDEEEGCYGVLEDCDPGLICGEAITCIDGMLYPTTCGPENCDEPIGECDGGDGDSDGPPECLLDCEGIENINLDDDPYRACELILELSQTECIEDCVDEEMVVIDYVVEGCQQCLENNSDCSQVFSDNTECDCDISENCDEDCDCDNDCQGENCFSDCEGVEDINPSEDADGFCMWIIDLEEECISDCQDVEGLYFICSACLEDPNIDCISFFQDCECDISDGCDENCECDNDCENDGIDECFYDCEELLDISDQDPNGICEAFLSIDGSECTEDCSVDAMAELSFINLLCEQCLINNSCDDLFGGDEVEFGRLKGSVQYIFGDYIDFIPQAEVLIVGLNNNFVQTPFEEVVFTDENGFFEIDLPEGMYNVTAYAFNEELTQEIYIEVGEEYNLDFILGDFGGGWEGLLGDINSDFEINVLDVVLLVNFVLGVDEPIESQFMLSDMNGDGEINILDVVQVINIILDR